MPPVFTEQNPWLEKYASKISRTGYFFAAVLLHLVVGILVATLVIFPGLNPIPVRFDPVFVPSIKPSPTPAPSSNPLPKLDTPPATADVPDPIKGDNSNPSFVPPVPAISPGTSLPPGVGPILIRRTENPAHTNDSIGPGRMTEIKKTVGLFQDPRNIPLAREDIRNLQLKKFPVYLASYADGDWGCNVSFDGSGQILAGSLPNLVAKITEWSHGQIPGEVEPQPLNIASTDLLDKRPPFIFFTGHKDFRLTEQEVKNLRDYVFVGGCIWGDNALPGVGSRFDVAFRREMQRVLPDVDIAFKAFAPDADIFRQKWFPLQSLPPGMNFYAEDIEHLDLGGKVAVIYTPNDYSDMFSMRILPGDKTIVGASPPRHSTSPLYTSGVFLFNNQLFFRNFDLQPCLQSDKLGMDIVTYLLTRFQDELLLTP